MVRRRLSAYADGLGTTIHGFARCNVFLPIETRGCQGQALSAKPTFVGGA
jgi:hypothetical protein